MKQVMKRRVWKCVVSMLLTCVIFFLVLYVPAYADGFGPSSSETSGTCGDHVTWQLDTDSVLTISGTGEIIDDHGGWLCRHCNVCMC